MAEVELLCGNDIYACAAPSPSKDLNEGGEKNLLNVLKANSTAPEPNLVILMIQTPFGVERSFSTRKASRQPQTAWTERKDSLGV